MPDLMANLAQRPLTGRIERVDDGYAVIGYDGGEARMLLTFLREALSDPAITVESTLRLAQSQDGQIQMTKESR